MAAFVNTTTLDVSVNVEDDTAVDVAEWYLNVFVCCSECVAKVNVAKFGSDKSYEYSCVYVYIYLCAYEYAYTYIILVEIYNKIKGTKKYIYYMYS